ncbi:Flp pilus assembly complex ATPase component TadA [Candidatus Woesearchaeota archaeon]|nr:Flp pilus assembly complex ATPase component TadA [Candidatus Woesearchaeota archaeon]
MGGRVIVPDTSVIIECILSAKIKDLRPDKIIIHEAVLAELEHQANIGKTIGFIGLEELQQLQELATQYNIELEFAGQRPSPQAINHAKSGEIDAIIRDLAYSESAILLTADKVQAQVAKAKNIDVLLETIIVKKKKSVLEEYFDNQTMSVHLREGTKPTAKKGIPGSWKLVIIKNKTLNAKDLRLIARDLVEQANNRDDSFVELERDGSTILQIGKFRIVITKPALSDGWEITAVRPVKKLSLNDYKLSTKLSDRIQTQAEGIMIAGAPGHGKSTFAQALAEHYATKNKIVKTIEAPRDLQLDASITQYAKSHASTEELNDMLLLTRPDYTIFDELRNTEDFRLFSDLRLAGVGMIGVVHATNPLDAAQRFIGKIELGVIAQTIDTIIFIQNGQVAKALSLQMTVKVPSGMTEADLARPVISVEDFETGKLEFEIYSYGEQTVIIPVTKEVQPTILKLAQKTLQEKISKLQKDAKVEVVSTTKAIIYYPKNEIGKLLGAKGERIKRLEQELGLALDVMPLDNYTETSEGLDFKFSKTTTSLIFSLDDSIIGKEVKIIVGGDKLIVAKVSKKAQLKIKRNNKIAKILEKAIKNNEQITLLI